MIRIFLFILTLAYAFIVFTTEESDIYRLALGLSGVICLMGILLNRTDRKSDKNKVGHDDDDENEVGSSN